MRIAVLSDIHGNYRALEAVLSDLDTLKVDSIVSLGDNIGYGPEPEEVVRALRERQVLSVMGNHELGLISVGYYHRLNPGPRESLDLTRKLLSPSSMNWLSNLPAVLLVHGGRFVHGSPPESITTYLFSPSGNRLRRLFAGYSETYCFAGHTHTLAWYILRQDGRLERRQPQIGIVHAGGPADRHLLLPGSVGQPRDRLSNKAKYCIWDTETQEIEIRAVGYDVETTIRLLGERGFPVSNARRLQW